VLEAHLGEGDNVNPDAWRAALRREAASAEMLDKHPVLLVPGDADSPQALTRSGSV
jgi:hypothetical protein